MRSDFFHLDIFQGTKTGKKFAIFVFGMGKKFVFLAKIFTLVLWCNSLIGGADNHAVGIMPLLSFGVRELHYDSLSKLLIA